MPDFPRLKPRILLVEDDPDRIAAFRQWLAGSVHQSAFALIEASSGGQAMGVVQRGGEGVAGICLDHDLNSHPRTELDNVTSGTSVVTAICNRFSRRVPILVHSMNTLKGENMFKRLRGAGFPATRIRMAALTAERFCSWLDEVHDSLDWD